MKFIPPFSKSFYGYAWVGIPTGKSLLFPKYIIIMQRWRHSAMVLISNQTVFKQNIDIFNFKMHYDVIAK